MKTARKAGIKSKDSRKSKYILPTPPLQRRSLSPGRDSRPSSMQYDDDLSSESHLWKCIKKLKIFLVLGQSNLIFGLTESPTNYWASSKRNPEFLKEKKIGADTTMLATVQGPHAHIAQKSTSFFFRCKHCPLDQVF